jgi:hypothetical protein
MANYSIKFHDRNDFQKTIEVFVNKDNCISIITDDGQLNIIDLDISTSIKFAKTIRTEINKAKELNHE